ncbi:MAG: FkbM family methyltransferase [Solirubrobacterales bacterium]
MSLSPRLHSRVTDLIARNRHRRALSGIARGARFYLDAYENWSYDADRNGERRVLECLSSDEPSCIFDVGANVGEWTSIARQLCPEAQIHSFEVVEQIAGVLRSRFAREPRVTIVPTGLGKDQEEIAVKYFPESTELSGAVQEHPFPFELVSSPVQRGDAYCAEAGIDHIDLLKIDVEGMEYEVLLGFEEMFTDGAIAAVQFEYGPGNILTRRLLRDHYTFFSERNFGVGKIYPHGVEFRPYRFRDEDFLGPNYLAVRADKLELIERLRGKSRR